MMNRLRPVIHQFAHQTTTRISRCVGPRAAFSSSPNDFKYDTSAYDSFVPSPPTKLTIPMAEGISDATKFYVKYGVTNQRLKMLAQDKEMPVAVKWQKMMELYLTTQVHVLAGLGYSADEKGLTKYAHDVATCLMESDEDMQELFADLRRDTWRELVAAAFDLQISEMKSLSIVEARDIMHKVSSKMLEASILSEIKEQVQALPVYEEGSESDLTSKHHVIQHVIVNKVYLEGDPSIVEQAGFGSGDKGYAMMQCAMSDYEGDPLISQYAGAAMQKIWEAADLPISHIQQTLQQP